MTLALRRTVFADGERPPDDYEVHYAGRTVGRIYRMNSTGRDRGPAGGQTEGRGRAVTNLRSGRTAIDGSVTRRVE